MYPRRYEYPEIGDTVRVAGLFPHVGIFVGPNGGYADGVVHNDKNGGVRLASFAEFTGGRPWQVVSLPRPWHERLEIVEQALSLIGTQYDLLSFNCEHFVNLVKTGRPFSPTLRDFVGAATVIGLVWAAGRK